MCSFVRSVLADNPAEDRNLNVAAYLLLAFGDARGILHSVHNYCCLLYVYALFAVIHNDGAHSLHRWS